MKIKIKKSREVELSSPELSMMEKVPEQKSVKIRHIPLCTKFE